MGLFDKKRPHDEPAATSGKTPVHAVEGHEPSAPEAKIVIEMVAPPTGAVRVGPLAGAAAPATVLAVSPPVVANDSTATCASAVVLSL